MWRVIVVVALAACGRVRFDVRDDATTIDGGVIGTRVAYIKPAQTIAGAQFGALTAISDDGTTLATAAMIEGTAYVFRRSGATWVQEARIAAGTTTGNQFGRAIALSADGGTLAVSANLEAAERGTTYVFTRTGTTWSQPLALTASNADAGDDFGTSLALSADGNTLVVGAFFESSAATGVNGNQADNTAMHAGAVYVFTRSASGWSQQAYIKASNTDTLDLFGEAVALSGDGHTLAVGAPLEDSAATGIDGDQADNSMNEAGAVYVFTGPAWAQQAYVKASNTHLNDVTGSYAQFGWSVALSGDGNLLAVGARGEQSAATGIDGDQTDITATGSGAVYTFARVGATWSQTAYIKPSNTSAGGFFGEHVVYSRDATVLGVTSPLEDGGATGFDGAQTTAAQDSGAVYTFAPSPWRQTHYVKATNTEAMDAVASVAMSRDGSVIAIGAPLEDSAATGIDGDQTDNSKTDSGAVYVWY